MTIPFLAVDRELAIVAALVALIVAALTVSVGAWILLARDRRGPALSRPRPTGDGADGMGRHETGHASGGF